MPGLGSLNALNASGLTDKRKRISITRLNPDDSLGQTLALQYYPESLSDTKSVNYQDRTVPGGNLPIQAWVSGGEHIISFTAKFTTDVDLGKSTQNLDGEPDTAFAEDLAAKGLASRNIDLRVPMWWLRSFLMPTYNKDGTLLPPAKCLLEIPGSGIGLNSGVTDGTLDENSIVATMRQCDIELIAAFPSGAPRIMDIQLSFSHSPQYKGVVTFPGYSVDTLEPKIYGPNSYYKIGSK